jgi:hypothetical protein
MLFGYFRILRYTSTRFLPRLGLVDQESLRSFIEARARKGIIGNPHALWAQQQCDGFEVNE